MIKKVKRFFRSKAAKIGTVATGVASVVGTTSAMAASGDSSGAVASMTNAFGGIQADMLSTISSLAPLILTVVGAVVLWKFGIKFFKSIAK